MKMNKMQINITKILFLFILSLAYLLTNSKLNAETNNKIGLILPFTGEFQRYGERIQAAITAGNYCNLDFQVEDESCSAKTALNAYNKLSNIDNVFHSLAKCLDLE